MRSPGSPAHDAGPTRLRVQADRARQNETIHKLAAEQLARQMGVPLQPADIGSFADGETHVRISTDVRHSDVVIVQPTCPPVNDHLMVLALLSDAARAAGAAGPQCMPVLWWQ